MVPRYICELKVVHSEVTAHCVWFFALELDALGDELLLDDDSSYLDEASSAPSIPEGVPSDSKTNKVTLISVTSGCVSSVFVASFQFTICLTVVTVYFRVLVYLLVL